MWPVLRPDGETWEHAAGRERMWPCGSHSRRRDVQGQRPRGEAAPFELRVAREQDWSRSRALGPPTGPQDGPQEGD